ncbi:hypothetical protein PoMZ_09186, partial [Pyricularia oryzae]
FRPFANRKKDSKVNIYNITVYLLRAETLPSARICPSAQTDNNFNAKTLPLTYRKTIFAPAAK